MNAVTGKGGAGLEMTPAEFTPEHIAVAFLMKRFTEMPKEAFRDVLELVKQWMDPDTPVEEHAGIFETIREIVFPELVGGIQIGSAGTMPEKLQKRADHIGSQIKQHRKEKGYTQVQLAEKSGLDQPYICRLEAGGHSPSFKTLEKIAKALGVSVGDLDPSH